MVMGLNLHWQGTWTKVVDTGEGGLIGESVNVQWSKHWQCDSAQYIQDGSLGYQAKKGHILLLGLLFHHH